MAWYEHGQAIPWTHADIVIGDYMHHQAYILEYHDYKVSILSTYKFVVKMASK